MTEKSLNRTLTHNTHSLWAEAQDSISLIRNPTELNKGLRRTTAFYKLCQDMWVLRWIREIKLKNLTTADSLFMALMFVAFIQEVKLTILICAYYVYCLQMEHLNQVRERSEESILPSLLMFCVNAQTICHENPFITSWDSQKIIQSQEESLPVKWQMSSPLLIWRVTLETCMALQFVDLSSCFSS